MAVAFVIAIVLLYVYDPTTISFSYQCPFKKLTGLDCPGCGGQRAVHALLHLRFKEAFLFNPFLVIAGLYLVAVVIFNQLKGEKVAKIQRALASRTAVATYLTLMLIWAIARNLF